MDNMIKDAEKHFDRETIYMWIKKARYKCLRVIKENEKKR